MLLETDPEYIRRLNDVGILFFHWRKELQESVPCKVYRITHEWGTIWDHTHDYVQIWYVNKGEFFHTLAGERYRMVAGNLFVIPPYAVHRVDMIEGEELEVTGCEFLPQFIDPSYAGPATNDGATIYSSYLESFMTSEEHVRKKVTLTDADDIQVQAILEAMLQEYNRREDHFDLHLRADLLKLLAVLVRAYTDDMEADLSRVGDPNHRAILETINYINQHFAEDLRLDDVCRLAMMSKTYFCDLFKEATGKTFNHYLNELRLRRAMRLLLDRNLSVSDVCFMVGFNNVPYFSRKFKSVVGLAPSEYRKHAVRHPDGE